MNTTPILAGWQTFYMIIGSAGAALVGLQFVVMALIANRQQDTSHATISAFGTPTVVHFAGALLLAAVMGAPWTSLWGPTVALTLCAASGFTYAMRVIWHARRQQEYKPVGEDWWWYVILPCVLYAILLVAAVLLTSHTTTLLFAIAAVTLGLLMLGIRNAWDTVTYIVTEGPAQTRTMPEG